ncbi:MAG: CoA pyrophosphatase [Bacteroidia bacterium]|nr:CoA pyrophosphatase [Bacteroidia bacterium]
MIALYDLNGVVHFPLIKRPDYTGAHSGQISLPGGKAEAGETVIDTALREGEEEIGIRGSQLTVLGSLSEFFVIPSNFLVTPVVAVMHQVPKYVPDKREVARILEGNVAELVSESAVLVKEIVAAGMFQMRAPHFEIDGEVVWGATAMILNEFRTILREGVAR